MVQLSHPYMTAGRALAIWNLVGKVMSLLFNMLSRLVITFQLITQATEFSKFVGIQSAVL